MKVDLDQLQKELDFVESQGEGIIELFTNVVYSMMCELRAARALVSAVRVHHQHEFEELLEAYDELESSVSWRRSND